MVVVDGLAASGGYITAVAADHIVAQETSLVGSIGVLFQYPNVTDLLKTVGVKIETIKSSPLKAAPNGFEPTSPEARAAIEAIVLDTYAWFSDLVQERRHLDDATLDKVADGRVFTGRQALPLKLIDELGDEQRRGRMARQGKEHRPEDAGPRFQAEGPAQRPAVPAYRRGRGARRRRPGHVRPPARGIWRTAARRLNLDGLLALWHPSSSN